MAEQTNFELFRNSAVILRFQLTTPEPAPDYVTGWTTQFTVRHEDADWDAPDANSSIVIQVAGAISTVPNALKYGIFDVFLSAANTALLEDKKIYDWSFKRTDSGFEDVLAHGELRAWTTA